MSVQISLVDYFVPEFFTEYASVHISCVDFFVPIKDRQGSVFITLADYDMNDQYTLFVDPNLLGDSPFMATNPYFNNYGESGEQSLLDDLLVESIQIKGQDMWYVPRVLNNKDPYYVSDDTATFEKAYYIEIYIKSVEGFGGDGTHLSRMGGLEIRNSIVFTVSKTRFEDEIGFVEDIPRPREGDLIYFPLNAKCFQIMYVDNKPQFYPLGSLPVYDLHCELFEYSSQRFSTGVEEIDALQLNHTMDTLDYAIMDEDGNLVIDEANNVVISEKFVPDTIDKLTNNEEIQDDTDSVISWTEYDPFSGGKY